jgi:RNA-directed DNA polymerase
MSLLEELILHFGVGEADLTYLIATAPQRYKQYEIPKRRGGSRIIAQPSRELKLIQRYLLKEKLERLPVHRSAMAYVKGRNIFDNADAHKHDEIILKLDFKDFFHSIKPSDLTRYLRSAAPEGIRLEDSRYYERILFWGCGVATPLCLSIGAPTSPILSNILLFGLDEELATHAQIFGVRYTRYADDITVSGASVEAVLAFEKACRAAVARMKSPTLIFNEQKRGMYFRGQKRMVTGLKITPVGEISIGRERKRMTSSLLHRFSLGQLDAGATSYLKGMLGFAIANEPDFVGRMRRKYGNDIVDRVLAYQVPPRANR